MSVEAGKTLGTLPVTTRESFEFAGWFTQADGGTEFDTSEPVNEGLTLYAHWTQAQKKPSFNYWWIILIVALFVIIVVIIIIITKKKKDKKVTEPQETKPDDENKE